MKNLYDTITSTIKQRFGAKKENTIMNNVKSSLITSVSYDAASKKLTVATTQNGATYAFTGVPQSVVTELTNAPSKGRFFNQNIRGRFPTTKVSG
jgi:hypothetical protein